jgi:LacI family transcriptional regulator
MKRPTQADVARRAGVSRATVSYVMNNRVEQHIPISPETRQRVLDAIAELGYTPDSRAQSLRSGSTKTLGVLLPIYENPFFWQILTGITGEAELKGYSILLSPSSDNRQREQHLLRELAQQRVDGLILLTSFKTLPNPALLQLHQASKPIVQITSVKSEFDYVHDGYAEGTRSLMAHLFELGHRRIGFIYGVLEEPQGHDRLLTYKDVLKEAGLPIEDDLIVRCGQMLEDGYQATKELLSRPDRPTALLAINDLLGMAATRAAMDLGLGVPDDVSIAGFDNIPFSSYTVPRLTSVSGDPLELGRNAVRLLIKRLNDPDRPQEVVHASASLIIRESTGPARKS